MKKLFENIGSNRFKLITESTDEPVPKSTLVREGLKKVLASGGKEVSYKQLETVGMGYIRSIDEAKKTALKEARELALEFGYKDDENNAKFVKEVSWNDEESYKRSHGDNETDYDPVTKSISSAMSAANREDDTSNPEEGREVEIGKEIVARIRKLHSGEDKDLVAIEKLAQELIKMHGG
jgi:hypothetical protein